MRLRLACWGDAVHPSVDSLKDVAAVYQCSGCGGFVLVDLWLAVNGEDPIMDGVHPLASARPWPELPSGIADDHQEAWSCHLAGLHRASILMARSALQRTVRHLGASGRNLKGELDDLADSGKITRQLRDNADDVRLTGNDVAHPDELTAVSGGDAEASLEFLDDFLRTTVVIPEHQKARADSRGKQKR
jgi:hypothetical protein